MASFIGKSLSSLFGKKGGGKKGKKRRKKGGAKKSRAATARPPADPDAPREMTSQRRKIIEEAMAVQRAKADIFNDLNDEQKQKLYALALKTLLRQGRGDNGG